MIHLLTHNQIMYYAILLVWIAFNVWKWRLIYQTIFGTDGIQIPELFQLASIHLTIIYF